MERAGALQRWPEGADDRDFESVKDPGDSQSNDDEKVKPAPRQLVEPKRDAGPDHGPGFQRLHRPKRFLLSHRVERRIAQGNRLGNATEAQEFSVFQ